MAFETGTSLNHRDLLARLRRFITGRSVLSTPVYVGVGNGIMSAIDSTPASVSETWTITCIVTAANGGTFSVVGSVSGAQPNAVVGVPYSNAFISFLISDGSADFQLNNNFVFTTTRGQMSVDGNAWDLMRSDATELMVKGKGFGGTDEIYVNFKIFENAPSDIYNFVIQGAAGYIGANTVDDQPGQCRKVGLSLWNDPMKYWIIANGRRVIVVAKVSTFYVSGYFGLILPYGTPNQYPYPLFIGGNIPNRDTGSTAYYNTKNYTWDDYQNTNYWTPAASNSQHHLSNITFNDITNSQVFWLDGTWYDLTNGYSNGSGGGTPYSSHAFEVNHILPVNPYWSRENIDGSYEIVPHTLAMANPVRALAGELDGSYSISGFSNGAENTVTVGADTYLVVQNVFRNGVSDFAAILLA